MKAPLSWLAYVLALNAAVTTATAAESLTRHQRQVEHAGSVLQIAIPAGALALTWLADPDPEAEARMRNGSLLLMGGTPRHDLLLALGRTWAVTAGLKYSINETRPNGEPHSFPSGHASIAFAGAEFIRKEYGWRWATPAYLASGFVAWSRVEAKKHYTHDVIAGAVLGVLANHDLWVRRDATGEVKVSATTLTIGEATVPGLRLQWTH